MAEDQRKQDQQLRKHNQDATSTEYLVHNWLEALFAWFQVIVLWHEPYVSFCTILGLLSSVLLLTYFAPRFYATIMIALFFYNLNKFWFRHVWPEIRVPPEVDRDLEMRLDVDRFTLLHPQLMTLTELSRHARNLTKIVEVYLQKLLTLRQEKPAAFCSLICAIFMSTAYLGTRISGMGLLFIALLLIMTIPGTYVHLMPDDHKEELRARFQAFLSLHHIYSNDESEKTTEVSEIMTSSSSPPLLGSLGTSAIKHLGNLINNLTKKPPLAPTTSQSDAIISPPTSVQDDESSLAGTMLAHLKDDGAKVLYNLIDVTLMHGKKNRTTSPNLIDQGSSESGQNLLRRRTSKSSNIDQESQPLIDSDEDSQDEGFVMLG